MKSDLQPLIYRFHAWACAALVALLAVLAGCGGGGSNDSGIAGGGGPTALPQISGRIADGYLRGATVFWDCNGNMALDADEPSAVSTAGGRYTLGASPPAKAPLAACSLRALVPATAFDEDTGTAVGAAFMMAAVDGSPGFISPLTTLQNLGGFTEATILARFPAASRLPLSTDYIAAGDTGRQAHNAAKYLALSLQSVHGLITTENAEVRRAVLERALAQVPDSAYSGPDASPSGLAAFASALPRLDLSLSPVSATLDKATFTLVESAFSGANDPRRAVVQLAVDAINRHPEAVVGNTIYWHLIPAAERSTWGPQIVGGQNGFLDSETVVAMRTALLGAQQTGAAEIEAEGRKVVKQMTTVLAKNAREMTLTSLDSAVKLLPLSSIASKALGITRLNKIKLARTRAVTLLNRIENFTSFADACGGLAVDLGAVDALGEFADVSNVADIAISTAKCVAGLSKSPRMTVLFEEIAGGKGVVEGTADGDLIAILKALSDVTAALMDSAGLSVASAVYNESLGMFIASMHALNELNRKGDEASAVFESNNRRIIDSFNRIADATGSALMSARLTPYVRPAYLINIALPGVATVGVQASVHIDQRLAQPLAYRVTWGTYPNGTAVTNAPSSWSSSGGATTLSATYTLPGSYPVLVELYDNSLGVALVAFQILGDQIEVSCRAGTTPDPEGTCAVPPAPILPPVVASSLREDFTGNTVDETRWTDVGFSQWDNQPVGPVSIANGLAEFGSYGRLSSKGKVVVSGSKIVVETRMAGRGGNRDTGVYLIDTDESARNWLYFGDTTYSGWGMYVGAYGRYAGAAAFVQAQNNSSTSAWMEYRFTVEGNLLTIERGPTLQQIDASQTRTVTLAQSTSGRQFYLHIGTAGPAYSPGTYDWLEVRNVATSQASAFEDTFSGAALDLTRWSVTKAHGNGNAATLGMAGGFLTVNVPGGSCGGCGVTDGSVLAPRVSPLAGDFEVTLLGEELVRTSRDNTPPWNTIQLVLKTSSSEQVGIYIAGDVRHVGAARVAGHLIYMYSMDSSSAGVPDIFSTTALNVGQYYPFQFRIRRSSGQVYVAHRLSSQAAWTESAVRQALSPALLFTPTIVFGSGDGGGTQVNSSFSARLDAFSIR